MILKIIFLSLLCIVWGGLLDVLDKLSRILLHKNPILGRIALPIFILLGIAYAFIILFVINHL